MELFANIVDYIQSLTVFAKHSILGVLQGRCASCKTKKKLGALSFISQKNQDCNICRFLLLLNSILYSHYYSTVRHLSQIQYTCLWFQIDSPMHLNRSDIKQPPFTCSNHHINFMLTVSNLFDECEEIQSK